tara:strand:- start:130 stop:621 length:492 start_codon:yes stop_codon:yes gene_type:complete
MQITIKKLKSIGSGCLYNISSDGKKIEIKLSNTKTIFGIENQYNTKIIKWNLQKSELEKIQIIENLIIKEFKELQIDEVKSKIINKPNYPTMILTKINKNKTSNDIIKHESGEITSFKEINKTILYDVNLSLSSLFLKNEDDKNILHYTIETDLINKKGICVT